MNLLQSKVLNIMKTVHKICVDNGIKYSLCGGSMIGAVREKGFIPWDDDIDVFMELSEYNKFVDIVKHYKDDQIEFLLPDDKNSVYCFIKAIDKTTTFAEKTFSDNCKYAIGVYVDIFPLVPLKNDNIKRKVDCRRFILRLYALKVAKKDLPIKKKIFKPLVSIVSIKTYKKLILKFNKPNKNKKFLYDPDGYNYKSAVPKEWFDEYILLPFEDAEFYVIKEYDKYLTRIFGNYMQRPPKEEWHNHSYLYLDLNKPYKKYIEEQIKK